MLEPSEIDYKRLLVERLRDAPLGQGLGEVMNEAFYAEIDAPIKELLQSRISKQLSLSRAANNTRILGFNVANQSFSKEEHQRLNQWMGTYLQTKGASYQFVNFLGVIKNSKIEYAMLWSKKGPDDWRKYWYEPQGSKVWQGGDWYPTTKYDVFYSLDDLLGLDEIEFIKFLNQLAPIHLVLRILYGYIVGTTNLYTTPIVDYEHGTSIAEAHEIHRTSLYTTPVVYYDRGSYTSLNTNGYDLLLFDDGNELLIDNGQQLNEL